MEIYICNALPIELWVRTVTRHNQTVFQLHSKKEINLDNFKLQIETPTISFENNASIHKTNAFQEYYLIDCMGVKHKFKRQTK